MRAALEVTGLGVRRRRTWVLRECSLSVPAGRVAALVGPNGAGKTTLMHTAVGLLRPTEGGCPGGRGGGVRRAGQAAVRHLHRRRDAHLRPPHEPPLGRRRRRPTGSPIRASPREGRWAPCRAGSGRRWRSHWRWPAAPTCSCSTSRWPTSTRSPGTT
ncbi:ATP-binding cassette domain-containing protein [Streptosporangium saharense]|uniref:ATP-binding cassette domain-containing protein n=1 Tax=Streptosporangium saharense TaxID=1706840 RepID=UPI0033326028